MPSFYTTRDIINLSGLSVADPVPQSIHAYAHPSQPSLESSIVNDSTSRDEHHPSPTKPQFPRRHSAQIPATVDEEREFDESTSPGKSTTSPPRSANVWPTAGSADELGTFASVPAPDATLADGSQSLAANSYSRSPGRGSKLRSPGGVAATAANSGAEGDVAPANITKYACILSH